MKTTFDLPEALIGEIQRRAEQEGRKLDEVIADLLAGSLPPPGITNGQGRETVSKHLPLIKVRPAPPTDPRTMTTQEWCDWIKDVELQGEVERYEKALGHQHVDRADAGNAPAP